MLEKHSAVCYIFERSSGYRPEKKAHTVKNDMGLDLFRFNNRLYEGQTGLQIHDKVNLTSLKDRIERIGGMEKLQQAIDENIQRNGLSPRYTRPDEKRQDIFPSDRDENLVFATEANGEKHYYYRFYNENGIELFTRSNDKEFFATVYVRCNGYMIGFDQKHRLEEILKQLPTLEGGVYGEVERKFNEAISNPNCYADLGFARILGRMEEAKAHNAPILERREAEYRQREHDRAEQERRDKEAAEQKYAEAIEKAEKALLSGETIANLRINGKFLVLQLFREHGIELPLRTQGWVNNSLSSFSYKDGYFRAQCQGRLSDPFMSAVIKLHESVLAKRKLIEPFLTKEELQILIVGKRYDEIPGLSFESIGQGYGYKCREAYEAGESYICYIPEYCYNEETHELEIDSCYTKADFIALAGNEKMAYELFSAVDWQHPSSLWEEWEQSLDEGEKEDED